jgi:hypothetical protein
LSDSYPTIQDVLSDVQKEFMGCVEMHLDPPEHDDPSYRVEARYRVDGAGDLPSSEIVFTVAVDEDDSEISERRHAIEFFDDERGGVTGWVRHVMKRVEAGGSVFFWTESRFEVGGPGVPEGQARAEKVEAEVSAFIDKIRALDRQRKLVEVGV